MILSRLFRCQRIHRHPRHTSFAFCLKLPDSVELDFSEIGWVSSFFSKLMGSASQPPKKFFGPSGPRGPTHGPEGLKNRVLLYAIFVRMIGDAILLSYVSLGGADISCQTPGHHHHQQQPPTTPTTNHQTTNHQPQPKNAKLVCLNWAEVTVNSNKWETAIYMSI